MGTNFGETTASSAAVLYLSMKPDMISEGHQPVFRQYGKANPKHQAVTDCKRQAEVQKFLSK